MDVGGYPRSLIDANGYLVSVKFSGTLGSVESNRFLRYKVDIGGNLKLINFSGFPRFRFRV